MLTKIPDLLRIKSYYYFIFFVFIHVALLNFNAAEWGDSYRILRASNYVRELAYPLDEKRPPLYATLLAIRPASADPIYSGRVIMLGVSVSSFFVFFRILKIFFEKSTEKINLGLLLFSLTPVYLYWSLRLMADTFFTLFVLVVMYLLLELKSRLRIWYCVLLGFVVGFSILTRFEGYLLAVAVLVGILYMQGFTNIRHVFSKGLIIDIKANYKYVISYGVSLLAVVLPYMYWRNPLTSSYFEEPSNRAYDLNTVLIYVLSLFFIFGGVYFAYFVFKKRTSMLSLILRYPGMSSFLFAELLLILLWPAAIPRIFVPVVPILILYVVHAYFLVAQENQRPSVGDLLLLGSLLLAYIFGQYVYKLQFLVLIKPAFFLVVLLSLIQLWLLFKAKYIAYIYTVLLVIFVWSLSTLWIHRNIFKVITEANRYVVANLTGKIGYNDISSVSNWYLNDSANSAHVEGMYYDLPNKKNRTYDALVTSDVDYLIVTNEHNTDMTLDIEKVSHLEIIKEFKETINGKEFFTKIVKFKK